MILHEIMGKVPYTPPEKKETNLSEIKASRLTPEEKNTVEALNRVKRQIRRETIKQESSVKQEKKEKTFIATDENWGIIGVVSALAPEKAAAKIFHQKFKEKWGTTRKDPVEIRVQDPGIDNEYHFSVWVEGSESTENTDKEMDEKKAVKKLIVKKMN